MVSAPFNFNIFVHNDIIRVAESLVNATFPAKPQETHHYFSLFCTIQPLRSFFFHTDFQKFFLPFLL